MRSSVQNPGWLFDVGDEILPNYMGISFFADIRIPSLTNQDFHGSCQLVGFVAAAQVFPAASLEEAVRPALIGNLSSLVCRVGLEQTK